MKLCECGKEVIGHVNKKYCSQECADKVAAVLDKKWRIVNIDKVKDSNRRYFNNNKDSIRARRKIYYEKNKDSIMKRVKEYKLSNKDKVIGWTKKYNLKNKHRLKANFPLFRNIKRKYNINYGDNIYKSLESFEKSIKYIKDNIGKLCVVCNTTFKSKRESKYCSRECEYSRKAEKNKIRAKIWYENNKNIILEQRKEYREKNKELLRIKARQYYHNKRRLNERPSTSKRSS